MIINLTGSSIASEGKRAKLNVQNAKPIEIVEDEKTETITYSNNAANASEFRWWVYGERKEKPTKKTGTMTDHRKYYKCSEKKRTGCLATKIVITEPGGVKTQF